MTVDLRALAPGDEGWLAELHNRAFSDYAVPAQLDPSALAFYMDETDVRPELSFAAFVDGEPASFCLGALRGDRASVRGEGTHPDHRRQGLGGLVLEATLSAVRSAGASRIGLEVLVGNDPATALYERHGFVRRRRLLGYELAAPRGGLGRRLRGRLEPVESVDAVALLERWGWTDRPWQLEPDSLAHLPALSMGGQGVVIGRRRGRRFWLYALAVDPDRRGRGIGRRILAGLGVDAISVPALLPEEWTDAHGFLLAVGGKLEHHRQWEMRLPLDKP